MVNSANVVRVLISLMLAGMGNYITTIKPNYFVVFRTPWPLQSDVVWRRTHQLGGRLLMAGGLLSVVLVLLLPVSYRIGTFISVISLTTVIPLIYSYIYFHQEKPRQTNRK